MSIIIDPFTLDKTEGCLGTPLLLLKVVSIYPIGWKGTVFDSDIEAPEIFWSFTIDVAKIKIKF